MLRKVWAVGRVDLERIILVDRLKVDTDFLVFQCIPPAIRMLGGPTRSHGTDRRQAALEDDVGASEPSWLAARSAEELDAPDPDRSAVTAGRGGAFLAIEGSAANTDV